MPAVDRPTLICVTPVKNEAWILERFLQCAGQWADHIVVADQQSDDETREIARRFPKVILIDNDGPAYDEQARQKLLLDEARRIPVSGKRIIVALDADEMLTANWSESPEWDKLLAAPEGTVLWLRWANVGPGVKRAWLSEHYIPFGFVDDGSPHVGTVIHSPRVPVPEGAPGLRFDDLRVLHYQYANWARMESKQRWYQCWERLNHPEKRPVVIFRQYHHMYGVPEHRKIDVDPAWLAGYEREGINMREFAGDEVYRWDRELVELFRAHGTEPFRRLAVWDRDWPAVARTMGYAANGELKDPRTSFDRAVHAWLKKTQPNAGSVPVRVVQKALQAAGW